MKKYFIFLAIAMTINLLSAQDFALNQNSTFDFKGLYLNPKPLPFQDNQSTQVEKVDLFEFFNDNDQNVSFSNNTNDKNGINEKGRKNIKDHVRTFSINWW